MAKAVPLWPKTARVKRIGERASSNNNSKGPILIIMLARLAEVP